VQERDEPWLVGRRRPSQELLNEGRTRFEELMAAYARALASGRWPQFDAVSTDGLDGWPLVALQPWMSTGAGPHGGYFAPEALAATPQPKAGHARDA
jgi:hypothetical protein